MNNNTNTNKCHVAVLKGGYSLEREVSLNSGQLCSATLRGAGYRVSEIDVGDDIGEVLRRLNPGVVFNALHGRFGEDGCIQGMLEMMKIPYTHSGVLASSMAMFKPVAKTIFQANNIPVPAGRLVSFGELCTENNSSKAYVVKPVNEGSSIGVYIVTPGNNQHWQISAEKHWSPGKMLLVEEYIRGRELTVGLIGGKAMAVTEIVTTEPFYDYHAKYAAGGSYHVIPADIPSHIAQRVMEYSTAAYRALGCRGIARTDLRWDDSLGLDGIFMLELNTQPGMTSTSLVPEQAIATGMTLTQLVQWIVEDASCDR